MGKSHPEIDARLAEFIAAQHVFFVATAPLDATGHVNVSPKGLDSLRILDPRTVAYVDYTGSGIETVAHLRENGRITILFCAFCEPPFILRLYGRGEALTAGHPDFENLLDHFRDKVGARAVIRVALDRVTDACGLGVPLYDYRDERRHLPEKYHSATPDQIAEYRARENRTSIDGLPGID